MDKKEYMRNWQKENKDKINKYNRERRKKANEELKQNKVTINKDLKCCAKQTHYTVKMLEDIKYLAKEDGLDANDIIRIAIKEYIEKRIGKGD